MTESEITQSSDNASHYSLKSDGEHIEKSNTAHNGDIEHAGTHIAGAAHLTQEHREYLLARYGTLDLDPIPGPSDADPYNWPTWKKLSNLILVAFHACMATFTAAAIIPAYGEISEEFNTSVTRASYLTSLQIAILGGAPLLWKPLSSRYGRRPIFLLSLICSLAGNIGCAKSPTYATTAVCRAITAFFISPASAIGSGVVTETFFKKERAKYMGVWTLMITLGIPIGPFIFGFVTYHVGFRWIYWVLAITNGVQFILYLFLGPETRYLRRGIQHEGSVFKQEYMNLKRIDPQPFTFYEFIEPLVLLKYPSIAIASCAYAMIFVFGSVMMTVEIPTLFIEKFELNAQQIGLQFIGIIIGSVIGEQIGGRLSDFWMTRGSKKRGTRPEPEYRLWLSYSGFILAIVGVIVFLVQTAFAQQGKWNVTPIVGAAIGAGGNQIVTTVLVTYAVDCYPEKSSAVGVTITFVRQIWGFIGPFWFPPMFEQVGVAESAGVTTALMVGVSVIPTILVQWKGQKWRARWNPEE